MNKKVVILLVFILSLLMIFAGCTTAKSNIANGDFAKGFDGWTFKKDKDAAATPLTEPQYSGTESDIDKGHGKYISLDASKAGINYLYQDIKLKKDQVYCLSVDYKTERGFSGNGAVKGAWAGFIEDADHVIEIVTNTQGEWKSEKMYFRVSTDSPLRFAIGIGHPDGGKASGKVYFDNISITKADKGIAGETIQNIKIGKDKFTRADTKSNVLVAVGAILSVLCIVAFMYFYRKSMNREMLSTNKMASPIALFIYMMLVAFIIRFLIAIFSSGMVSEINYLASVARQFNGTKMNTVMDVSGATLPTGMMYLLWMLNGIAKGLHIQEGGFGMLIRLPFILADLVAIYMIYVMASKRMKEHSAILVAGLYAVLPSIVMASTGWGMVISLVGCLLIAMFSCMLNKNYIGVGTLFTVSLMFSNLTLLALPLVLAFYINALIKYDDSRVKIGLTSLIALVAFYCLAIPFVSKHMSSGHPFYVFELMIKDLTAINVLTANAFGLYGMIGMNAMPLNTAMNVLNYIFVIMIMLATIVLYIKNRDRLNILLMASFTFIATSTLCARANIETMVIGISLLFLYAVFANSRRVYALVGGFSTLSFLNMGLIMSNSGFISNQLNAEKLINFHRMDATFIAMSVIAVLMTIYFAYVVFDICYRSREVEITPLDGKLSQDFKDRYAAFKARRRNAKEETAEEQ